MKSRGVAVGVLLLCACAQQRASGPATEAGAGLREEVGWASWYGRRFHGRRTASGRRFDAKALTAAHRTLPFGTLVRVTNLANDRAVEVEVTDRGPFIRRRIIDLSHGAARAIGMLGAGVARVRVKVIGTE